MFNLANTLSLIRILGVPILICLLFFHSRLLCLLATLLFILITLTDMIDGFVARKYNQITNLGKFLDPLADKILICSVLVMLVELHWVKGWIAIVIISREIMVTGLRAIAAEQGKVIAADKFGKLKTILQIVAICPLLLHYSWFGIDPVPAGTVLLWAALAITVFSGCNYLRHSYRVLQN